MGPTTRDSPCYGPVTPGLSHCRVTGVFEQVVPAPEPATLPLSLAALGLFTIARRANPPVLIRRAGIFPLSARRPAPK